MTCARDQVTQWAYFGIPNEELSFAQKENSNIEQGWKTGLSLHWFGISCAANVRAAINYWTQSVDQFFGSVAGAVFQG